jgi:NADPH2:quinone reductase
VIIDVKAVAVENVDKAIAAGTHYAGEKYNGRFPAIPVFDGIGALPDGTLVGFGNIRPPYGALAEKTVVPEGSYMPIPEGIDPAVVASAVTAMSMRTAAGFAPGETVLVQGATGRDDDQLREVRALGADTVINTAVTDEALTRAYLDAKGEGYDVVVDYLWGRPSEILLRALVPRSFAFGRPTRVVQIGESGGTEVAIAGSSLRGEGSAERHRDRLAANRSQGQAARRDAMNLGRSAIYIEFKAFCPHNHHSPSRCSSAPTERALPFRYCE